MRRLRVLVLGETSTAEMRPAFEMLENAVRDGDMRHFADADVDRLRTISTGWFADLVVVFQSWPDEFSSADVRRLLTLFPLARWICCYGSWCESDGRTRNIWPPGMRISVRYAPQRIQCELSACRDPNSPAALPWTAGPDEVFAYDATMARLPRGSGELIRINTPDSELWYYLRDLLTAAGYRVPADASGGEDAIVWDIDPLREEVLAELREYRGRNNRARLIALAGWVHPEDVELLEACGVDAVVDKLRSCQILPEALAAQFARTRVRDAG